jgi:hypothetical protein
MNQNDETNALLPGWLAEHTVSIEQLCQSKTDLCELLDDHARLTKAIDYWNGKSEERVEEFRCMAKELQHEIVTMLTQE